MGGGDSQSSSSTTTEINLTDLSVERDYAIKVAAVDAANNEGPATDTAFAYRLLPHSSLDAVAADAQRTDDDDDADEDIDSDDTSEVAENVNSNASAQKLSEQIGVPRDLEVLEFTSSSVKFAWMPPEPTAGAHIKYFLISYVDRVKQYRESNGAGLHYKIKFNFIFIFINRFPNRELVKKNSMRALSS